MSMTIKRRKTRTVDIGGVRVGGNNPVAVQSMAKTPTSDVAATARQINALQALGCEICRVAVKDMRDAAAIAGIKKRIHVPLVADIHFDWKLAIAAIECGADKIRLNPGNIFRRDQVRAVCGLAKRKGIPIRVGLNSGSVGTSRDQVRLMLAKARAYIGLLESQDFRDIVVSLKCQSAVDTVAAYRQFSAVSDYPVHLGVTATGPSAEGVIKSSAALGALLIDGIGDTVRISLTDDPREEVKACRCLLQSLGIRNFGAEIVSCPTCGRCRVDLVSIVNSLQDKLLAAGKGKKLQIAVMGCEVNGPGEARHADIGVAFGAGTGLLFKKGKPVRKLSTTNCVTELLKEIKRFK